MEEIIISLINQFGYIGICFLIAVENIFPPIPSEVILTFGGFATSITNINIYGVILSATIGSVLGAICLYYIGRVLSVERLGKLCESKLGKLLHLKVADITLAETWFKKHGTKAIFFCRFIPIVRSLISIPAGISKMKFSSFLSLTILGTLIWNTILSFLGKLAGDSWESIAKYFDVYSSVALVVIIIVILAVGAIYFKKRIYNKPNA